jgi:hypothetical protein
VRFSDAVTIAGLLASPLFHANSKAQAGSILHVEIVNSTLYRRGYCSIADQGKDPTKLPTSTITPFVTGIGVGDIVSVNSQPVKGTALQYFQGGSLSSTFTPGTKIADITSAPSGASWDLTFLNPDGTLVGSIHIDGNGGGPPPPGAPKEVSGSSLMVTGGTGPFFGARGYWQPTQDSVSGERQTTDCEDPAYRRINADAGGNKRHGVLYLVAMTAPQVVITPSGHAVVHAGDGSLVTSAKPTRAGEILTLFATGLGPTKPGVDPGQPFPASPPQIVNSPVQVLVNGNPSEVLYAGGYPGAVDGYQVNFRVPDGTPSGQASLQVAAAWITGAAINIPVE